MPESSSANASLFAKEKEAVANLIALLPFGSGLRSLMIAAGELAKSLFEESNGSATKITLAKIIDRLITIDLDDLSVNLRWLEQYLRNSPDEPIDPETFVPRIRKEAKRVASNTKE